MSGAWASQKLKLGAAVVLFVAAGGLLMYFWRSDPIAPSVNFVCVATGKTFAIDRTRIEEVPMRNPQTGEKTLLPCYLDEGVLRVSPRYRDSLTALAEKNLYVDPKTLAVRSKP
jgi:hypothetical protein